MTDPGKPTQRLLAVMSAAFGLIVAGLALKLAGNSGVGGVLILVGACIDIPIAIKLKRAAR